MRIFLIGYMGSGKTSVGKKIARALGLQFLDLDHYIESSEQLSIAAIFDAKGEAEFRKLERKYLDQLLTTENVLFSLGGGTPCFSDTMDVLMDKGLCVYLEHSPKSLYNRLLSGKKGRPLLQGKTDEELLTYIEQHLSSRLPYYQRAHVTINGLSFSKEKIKDTVQTIQSSFKENF